MSQSGSTLSYQIKVLEAMNVVEKKGEVRVFVDGLYLKLIDDLISTGYGTNRSEVIRMMIHDWAMANLERAKGLIEYTKKG